MHALSNPAPPFASATGITFITAISDVEFFFHKEWDITQQSHRFSGMLGLAIGIRTEITPFFPAVTPQQSTATHNEADSFLSAGTDNNPAALQPNSSFDRSSDTYFRQNSA
jgi:hypothetical protein